METKTYKLNEGNILEIREAEPDDASALIAYIDRVSEQSDFLLIGPGEFELSESEERAFIENNKAAVNQLIILGFIDGEIVGCLRFTGGQRARIQHTGEFGISVEKEFWGLGIGSLMVDTLIQWAEKNAVVNKLNLRVRTDNERAIKIYKNKGFRIEGTISKEILIDGIYFDHYCMGLEL